MTNNIVSLSTGRLTDRSCELEALSRIVGSAFFELQQVGLIETELSPSQVSALCHQLFLTHKTDASGPTMPRELAFCVRLMKPYRFGGAQGA